MPPRDYDVRRLKAYFEPSRKVDVTKEELAHHRHCLSVNVHRSGRPLIPTVRGGYNTDKIQQ